MSGPALRPARPADATAMVDVIEAAYRGEGGWTTESHLVSGSRTTVAEVSELLSDPCRIVIVAQRPAVEEAGDAAPGDAEPRIVGCCSVRLPATSATPADPASGSAALPEFGLFAVDPRAQSGGIGRRLLEAAEERLRDAGFPALMIEVLQTRPELRAWYERRGFVATGEVMPFPGQGLKVAGLAMDVLVKRLD